MQRWEQLVAESCELKGSFVKPLECGKLKLLKYLHSKAPWRYKIEKETAGSMLCGRFCT